MSPKCYPVVAGFARITELKYVVGRAFREERVEEHRADYVYLQPESSEPRYVQKALEILKRHPRWRLSTRIHKTLGLPLSTIRRWTQMDADGRNGRRTHSRLLKRRYHARRS